jgi:hypothetical protein
MLSLLFARNVFRLFRLPGHESAEFLTAVCLFSISEKHVCKKIAWPVQVFGYFVPNSFRLGHIYVLAVQECVIKAQCTWNPRLFLSPVRAHEGVSYHSYMSLILRDVSWIPDSSSQDRHPAALDIIHPILSMSPSLKATPVPRPF